MVPLAPHPQQHLLLSPAFLRASPAAARGETQGWLPCFSSNSLLNGHTVRYHSSFRVPAVTITYAQLTGEQGRDGAEGWEPWCSGNLKGKHRFTQGHTANWRQSSGSHFSPDSLSLWLLGELRVDRKYALGFPDTFLFSWDPANCHQFILTGDKLWFSPPLSSSRRMQARRLLDAWLQPLVKATFHNPSQGNLARCLLPVV